MSAHIFAKFNDGDYPVGVVDDQVRGHSEQNLSAPFEALEKVGLLTSKRADLMGAAIGRPMPGKEYSLSEAGNKALAKP